MSASVETLRSADAGALSAFVGAMFRYADPGSYVSLRAFHDLENKTFSLDAVQLAADPQSLVQDAFRLATRCARSAKPVVFCPPVATFSSSKQAREADLQNGLALSVECDANPAAACKTLEALLGPATMVVASGGEWPHPETGLYEPKLHLHWRLNEPTRDMESHRLLKRARTLATALVGGDASNQPIVHPIRWPGSWHCKKTPRLATIQSETEHEIDLQEAVERLEEAAAAGGRQIPNQAPDIATQADGEERETAELTRTILTGGDYHSALTTMAMRLLVGGTPDGQAVHLLRGMMQAVPDAIRDMKDGMIQPGRWKARYDDIPRAVNTARAKLGEKPSNAPDQANAPADSQPKPDLHALLSVQAWSEISLPPQDRLLGDVLTTTSRMFLVGSTGLGKTMLGFAMACGMAAGTGFLHWRSTRPARVLYVDGEMPGELIKARSLDVLRRADTAPARGNLVIYARDFEEQLAIAYPTLGKIQPLNTEQGQNFIYALVDMLGGVDCVIFDNVMSLISGDQKDEIPWSETLPLVSKLTAMRIGQVWLDHTGHNTTRQYGSSTKAWRFDAVGVMAPLGDDERQSREVGFTLSFEAPGKARRRTPENWQDFETCTIRLADDRWTSDKQSHTSRVPRDRVSPTAQSLYGALLDAVVISDRPGETTREAWYHEGVRLGLLDPINDTDTAVIKDRKQSKMRKSLGELKTANWIGVDGNVVRPLRREAGK